MKKRSILWIFLACICCQVVQGQQLPLFNIYRDHWNILNPAHISNNYLLYKCPTSVGVSYRQQWFKLADSPATQVVNAEAVLPNQNIVTGGYIINDQTGKLKNIGIYGQFAYRLPLEGSIITQNKKQELVIGINAGMVQPWRLNANDIRLQNPDEALSEYQQNWFPDFSFGVFYYLNDQFYAGFSVPQIISLNRYLNNNNPGFPRVPHYYAVIGGYKEIDLGGFGLSTLESSMWVRHVPGSPLSMDLNLRCSVEDNYWLGLGLGLGLGTEITSTYRLETGVLLSELLGFEKAQLKIGMAYDILHLASTQSIGSQFGGAGEINLVYSWGR